MSQGTLVKSTHYSPSRQACQRISRGPGECLCSSGICLCTQRHAFTLHTALLRPQAGRQHRRIRVEETCTTSSVPETKSTFHLTALYRWRCSARLCDQGSACGRSQNLPCPGSNSHPLLRAHLQPCDQERKFQSHDVITMFCGEGIVDTRELARKLILNLVLAESKRAIASHQQRRSLARLGWVNRGA